MVIPDVRQGQIWLADLGEPVGSAAGYQRPVVIVQGNRVNASRLDTYLATPLTGNLRLSQFPTNLLMASSGTGLPKDSVAQVTLTLAIDQSQLIEVLGMLDGRLLQQLFTRLDLVLGRI
jgi:mRNA interferase MazF